MNNPKITVKDAAKCLGYTEKKLLKLLKECGLAVKKTQSGAYFTHDIARQILNIRDWTSKIFSFQIVKGGTGKTSLAHEFAIRSSLYGLKVLCIDLDQQGNLTHSFGCDANEQPVIIDILAEGYTFDEAIINVLPGVDLLGSRIENAMLDDVIRLKDYPLQKVYRHPMQKLKKKYDLIVLDCPPNLGPSVVAATLAADAVISPVTPDRFALAGLACTCQMLAELNTRYRMTLDNKIILNKYDSRLKMSQEAFKSLKAEKAYKKHLLSSIIRNSHDFPKTISKEQSIFNDLKASSAKADIDAFTKELLRLNTSKKANNVLIKSLVEA